MSARDGGPGPPVRAIVFDLYGTLLRITRPMIGRELPRLLGVGARAWMALVRDGLMTTPFGDRAEFLRFIREKTGADWSSDVETAALALLDHEIRSVELVDGVHATLGFLKRRGLRLGLVSNLTSLHRAPVSRFGLDDYFTATAFSCDVGMLKPEPRIYRELCSRLGVEPEDALVVGDSLPNDVRAPRGLKMRALLVDSRRPGAICGVSELGWRVLEDGASHFVPEGTSVRFGADQGTLRGLRPMPDALQGRMNLVAQARFHGATVCGVEGPGTGEDVFCKRYLFPETAYVEEFMHELLARLGVSHCRAAVHPGPEPVLIVTRAPGSKFVGPVDPTLAYEVGRHSAIAYIFANADWRPRNAFVSHEDGRPVITVIDLEHCLFNLALDVSGLSRPERPESIDALGDDEVARRLRRKVLSERTTRRAMGTFVELESFDSDVARSFREGWVSAYEGVQSAEDDLCGRIEERIYTEPFLVIGTAAYRRAMARLDLDDVRSRVRQDPEVLFPELAAVRSRDVSPRNA